MVPDTLSAIQVMSMAVRWRWRVVAAGLMALAASGAMGAPPAASEGDFRLENKVYVGNQDQPRVESTTIFSGGVVYDYLKEPPETTVFDPAERRFVLLDLARKVRTEVTTEAVLRFIRRLKEQYRSGPRADPYTKFLASPHFDQGFDESTGELTFRSSWMTYRLRGVDAESPEMARQYREFSDWQLRLNTLINPGHRLPFARMVVNAALEQRVQLPREVHLTLAPRKGFPSRQTTVRSEHQLARQLVESDRDRVAQTGELMVIYPAVAFEQYQREFQDR
jgi:hypothetical protein